MCTGLEVAALIGTGLSVHEATKGPKKTGEPKAPVDKEAGIAETQKRARRAKASASGGYGTQATFTGGKKTLGG